MSETQRILNQSIETINLTDSKGRSLEIRRPSRREIMQHMRQWGAASNVEQWFALALLTATVRSIDGKPIPPSRTPEQVEAIADMLGDEGIEAVGTWYQDQAQPDINAEKNEAKN